MLIAALLILLILVILFRDEIRSCLGFLFVWMLIYALWSSVGIVGKVIMVIIGIAVGGFLLLGFIGQAYERMTGKSLDR